MNKSKKKRSLLLKIIYLIQNNKIFEARELILNQLKNDKSLNEIKKLINKEILKKIYFCIFFPFYYLKKLIIKMSIKVLHINYYDENGGAAIAVNRIHEALIRK